MLQWVDSLLLQFGWMGLLGVSLAEASFLPVAPDLLLIPLVGMNPQAAYVYAALAVAGSTVGSLLGYWIGRRAGLRILRKFMSEQRMEQIRQLLERFGFWTVVLAGLTPLPFKLFTIASGVFRVRRRVLVFGTVLGRSARFFGLALLVRESRVFHISIDMENEVINGLPVLLTLLAVYGYVRSKYSRKLRQQLVSLWHRLDHSVEWGMLITGTVCSFLIAVFGGDFALSCLRQAGGLLARPMMPLAVGALVTLLLWAAGCIGNGLVFLYVKERKMR